MKKIGLTLLVQLVLIHFTLCQNYFWLQYGGSTDDDASISVSSDQFGNAYVCGTFKLSMFSGSNQITSFGGADIFLAKYDNNGTLL